MVNEGESVTVCINVTNPPVEASLSLSGTLFLSGTHISGTASKWVELLLLFFKKHVVHVTSTHNCDI